MEYGARHRLALEIGESRQAHDARWIVNCRIAADRRNDLFLNGGPVRQNFNWRFQPPVNVNTVAAGDCNCRHWQPSAFELPFHVVRIDDTVKICEEATRFRYIVGCAASYLGSWVNADVDILPGGIFGCELCKLVWQFAGGNPEAFSP